MGTVNMIRNRDHLGIVVRMCIENLLYSRRYASQIPSDEPSANS